MFIKTEEMLLEDLKLEQYLVWYVEMVSKL